MSLNGMTMIYIESLGGGRADKPTNCKNDLYLNNFAQGIYTLSDDDLAALTAVAQQCYVTGGPSVFQARSMYWIATNSSDFAFQDNCLANTGNQRMKAPDTTFLVDIYTFKVFPNPLSGQSDINITSSEEGVISFSNLMGQVISIGNLVKGDNRFDLTSKGNIIFYQAQLSNGNLEKGKIVTLK